MTRLTRVRRAWRRVRRFVDVAVTFNAVAKAAQQWPRKLAHDALGAE